MRAVHVQRLIGIVAVGMLLSPGIALANRGEGAESKEDRLNHRVAKLTEKLTLTPDQVQKVRAVLESAQASKEADQAAMKQRKEQTDQQILAVLNDQQKAQYTKMQEEHKKKWEENKSKKGEGWHKDHKESE